MSNTWFHRLLARLRGTTPMPPAAAPKALPAVTPSGRGAQLTQAVDSLNHEFVTLNGKLMELRDALGTLRGALKQLEDANRRRAESAGGLVAVKRADLN